jgi:hypothetical protein
MDDNPIRIECVAGLHSFLQDEHGSYECEYCKSGKRQNSYELQDIIDRLKEVLK